MVDSLNFVDSFTALFMLEAVRQPSHRFDQRLTHAWVECLGRGSDGHGQRLNAQITTAQAVSVNGDTQDKEIKYGAQMPRILAVKENQSSSRSRGRQETPACKGRDNWI
ncbi:hypothetical protein ACJ73_03784 [Blastomyces percursus]|uniref:Uncharacterized protein n=1 Tax=Blastomyces percursus TaxID=1658174 RepID=A0A1J9Q8I8_9EURO|nr:hypothetical protein ACJ73_03784 [Blastomyces percursus]